MSDRDALYRERQARVSIEIERDKALAEAARWRGDLESLKSSLSWRLTAPLRAVDRLIRNHLRDGPGNSQSRVLTGFPESGGATILADVSRTIRNETSPGMRRVVEGFVRGALAAGVPLVPVEIRGGALLRAGAFFGQEAAPHPRVGCFLVLDAIWDRYRDYEELFPWCHGAGVPVAALFHDTIPLDHPEYCLREVVAAFDGWFEFAIAHCDAAVCVSRFTAERVEANTASRLRVGSRLRRFLTCEPGTGLGLATPQADALTPDGPYVLCVGTIEIRKNQLALLEAMERRWSRGDATHLVLVGSRGWNANVLLARLDAHGELGRRLWWFEHVEDDHLVALYSGAAVVAVPSLVEGFGLPVVEAAEHAKPLVLADIPVFREKVLAEAWWFSDGNSLDRAIDGALGAGRPTLVRSRSWEASALELGELLTGNCPDVPGRSGGA